MIKDSANVECELAYQSREDRMSKILKKNLKGIETSSDVVSFTYYLGGGSYEG
jgi:hypothetical protein